MVRRRYSFEQIERERLYSASLVEAGAEHTGVCERWKFAKLAEYGCLPLFYLGYVHI